MPLRLVKSSGLKSIRGLPRSNVPVMIPRLLRIWAKAIKWAFCGKKVFLGKRIPYEYFGLFA